MRIATIGFSFGVVALLLAGCLTGGALRGQRFETAQQSFESAMRWSDFAAAAGFLDDKVPPPDFSRYRNIKVVAFDPKQLTMAKDITEARVIAEIRYVNTRQMRERQVQAAFHWRYDDKEGRWRLVSPLPPIE